MRRIALLVALLLSAPVAAQPRCEAGTPKKPLLREEVFQVLGPNGNVGQFREAYIKINCNARDSWKKGLADAKGKLLVPADYFEVVPINETSAAVLDIDRRMISGNELRYRIYVFGKGLQKQVLPWSRVFSYDWNGVRAPYAFSIGSGEVALIQGDIAKPVVIRNLGGKGWGPGIDTFYQAKDTLIANFTAEDGTPVSRVLSMRGAPISPVIGAIERWETLSPEQAKDLSNWRPSGRYNYPILREDYISLVMSGTHAVLPYGKLYQPIAANGDPLPLPPGVIGVFPLKFDTHEWSGPTTHGWALVEETAQGLRVRPGIGTLQAVLARAASLPAYTGMSRFIERNKNYDAQKWSDLFAVRSPGEAIWRIIDAQTLGNGPGGPIRSTGINPGDAVANLKADTEAARRNFTAQREREQAIVAARIGKEQEALHQQLLASGRICDWRQGEPTRGPQTVNYMLASCPISNDAFFNMARSIGADPDLLGKAEYKYWKAKGRYDTPIPPAPRDIYATPNWAAWGDAIIKSARESTDSFIRDSKRRYYSNMEAWNRGKQNWCC